MLNGLIQHLTLTLRLNFRSKLTLIYGYLMPVLFLIAFASVFRAAKPPVVHELGQLLTISTLGGACFGMPTALVAERERGIWRRYRLLPTATGSLVLSVLIARMILVASSALLQVGLAMAIYKMPSPLHPLQLIGAYVVVAGAFMAMGLVIAMLADTVPAVQALGQSIFLPMILIGGVGIPLRALPPWAQTVAGFLPGRYAVQALDAAVAGTGHDLNSLAALAVIGIAAMVAGANMFRWDAGQKIAPKARRWAAAALAAWAAVGIVAMVRGDSAPPPPAPAAAAGYATITPAQIDSITYDDLPDDNGFITPIVESVDDLNPSIKKWMQDFRPRLATWPPGHDPDPLRRTVNLLSVAAIADLDEYQYEGEIPVVAFQQLRAQIPADQLKQILAYIILQPSVPVLTTAADLGIPGQPPESDIRDRARIYARKFLGRLLGKIG
jgi:ABC-2 type transport system permease protein